MGYTSQHAKNLGKKKLLAQEKRENSQIESVPMQQELDVII